MKKKPTFGSKILEGARDALRFAQGDRRGARMTEFKKGPKGKTLRHETTYDSKNQPHTVIKDDIVTPSCGNIFRDIGFSPKEAAALEREALARIKKLKSLKARKKTGSRSGSAKSRGPGRKKS